jgi:hypothetical protein
MANGFLIGIAVLFGLILLSGLIWLVVSIFGDKKDPRNKPYIINYLSVYTGDYGILIESKKESVGNYWRITASPRDVDYIELKNKEIKLRPIKLYVRKDLYIPIGNSGHREIYEAFPSDPMDLPERTKSESRGKALIKEIKHKNELLENHYIEENANDVTFKLNMELEGLEKMNRIFDINKGFLEKVFERKVQDKQNE